MILGAETHENEQNWFISAKGWDMEKGQHCYIDKNQRDCLMLSQWFHGMHKQIAFVQQTFRLAM